MHLLSFLKEIFTVYKTQGLRRTVLLFIEALENFHFIASALKSLCVCVCVFLYKCIIFPLAGSQNFVLWLVSVWYAELICEVFSH